jgi:hypothetical protein
MKVIIVNTPSEEASKRTFQYLNKILREKAMKIEEDLKAGKTEEEYLEELRMKGGSKDTKDKR